MMVSISCFWATMCSHSLVTLAQVTTPIVLVLCWCSWCLQQVPVTDWVHRVHETIRTNNATWYESTQLCDIFPILGKMELFISPNSHDTQRVAEPDVLGHFRVKYPLHPNTSYKMLICSFNQLWVIRTLCAYTMPVSDGTRPTELFFNLFQYDLECVDTF